MRTEIKTVDKRKIYIPSIYRSPQFNTLEFVEVLAEYLETYCSKYNEIIAGDINRNTLNNNYLTQFYNALMASNEFLPAIKSPTREAEESSSCIDHFYIKSNLNRKNIVGYVLHFKITDHYPVILSVSFENDISTS